MHMKSFRRLMLSVALVVAGWSSSALAATVTVAKSGNSSYVLMGSDMDGASGIQLDITYDSTSLATPTVTQGSLTSGAIFQANTTRAGSIKIAVISSTPFSSNGPIATISFASRTGNGGITSVVPIVIDSKGSSISSSASNQTNDAVNASNQATATPSPSPSQSPNPTQTTQSTGTANPIYGGTVSLPVDQPQQRSDTQPTVSSPVPAPAGEAPVKTTEQTPPPNKPVSETKPEETPQFVVYKGIAERFKHYSGSKTLSAMVKLFDKQIAQTVQQEPPVLVTDGKTKATLTVNIPSRITSSVNFAVNGGTLVSYKQEKQIKGRWIVSVQPNPGSNNVALTIIAGTEEFEYPLTVVQPVKTTLTLDEKGWNKFSKEVGTATAPQHDFNSDGVRDYLDEYIFVANFLASKKAAITKPAAPAKKTAK